jgi:inosine-uridine nucleoside N-ribohydrolase
LKLIQHPHLTPDESWKTLFKTHPSGETVNPQDSAPPTSSFVASRLVAHKEILRVLRENDLDTITIVAVGPLTNLALAAAEDLETFLRVKEVVVMSGAVEVEGNVSPTPCRYRSFSPSLFLPLSGLNPSDGMRETGDPCCRIQLFCRRKP